jgi:hypothetical protein
MGAPPQRTVRQGVKPVGRLVASTVLILISGAFMVWAGYAFAEGRIAFGLWITTPPGFTIETAFLLLRRHDRYRGRSAPSLFTRIGQEGTILLAGGVMVLAGYAGADWSWSVASVLILLGLPLMAAVVWLGRRGSHTLATREVRPETSAGRSRVRRPMGVAIDSIHKAVHMSNR